MRLPVGPALAGWTPRPRPTPTVHAGRFVRLEPVDPDRHAGPLFAAYAEDLDARLWTYLSHGPYADAGGLHAWLSTVAAGDDPLCSVIVDVASGQPRGVAALMRVDERSGSIEVGGIAYSPALQRTVGATEAMYLLMRHAFDDLGYRRYEWKCDALNAASQAAARRLGFVPEGVHRQAVVYKRRSRDTAWFSVLDREWPRLRSAFEAWLDPANLDAQGRQRLSLAALRDPGS